MDLSPFWDFCRHTGSLLVALALVGCWAGPRVDRLLDALMKFIAHTADLKPQLDKIEAAQATVCRFEPAAPGIKLTASTAAVDR